MIGFALPLGIALLFMAQHPFITYPLSLWSWQRLRRNPIALDDSAAPSIAILCCCHNEAIVIADKLDSQCRALARYKGNAEQLYYLDGCTDATAEVLGRAEPAVGIYSSATRGGKSLGMAHLVGKTNADILIFTDANTYPTTEAVREIVKPFGDPTVGGVSARTIYTNSRASEVANINSIYWRLEEWIKAAESSIGSTTGTDGGFFAIRRSLYVPTPPDIIDDMHTSLKVIMAGWRFISCSTSIVFEKTATSRSDEFRRKARIACRAFNCFRLLRRDIVASPFTFQYMFYSHKLLRWFCLPAAFGGWTLICLYTAARYGRSWSAIVVLAPLLLLALGAAGARPFKTLYEIVVTLTAVTLGIFESLRNKRYQTWQAASSGR